MVYLQISVTTSWAELKFSLLRAIKSYFKEVETVLEDFCIQVSLSFAYQ